MKNPFLSQHAENIVREKNHMNRKLCKKKILAPVQCVKPLSAVLASHVSDRVPGASLPIQFPANAPRRSVEERPSAWGP